MDDSGDFWPVERGRAKEVVAQGRQRFTGKLGGSPDGWWLHEALAADGLPVNVASVDDDFPVILEGVCETGDVVELEATPRDNEVSIVLIDVAEFRRVRGARAPD